MNKMRRRVIVVTVLAGAALFAAIQVLSASAGSGHTTPADPFAGYVATSEPDSPLANVAVHRVTGVIAGRLYVSGGPPSTGHGVHPADRFTVVVTRGTRTLAKTITTRRGAFSIHIAPGGYELVGKPGACRAKKVVVKAERTTRARLYCALL